MSKHFELSQYLRVGDMNRTIELVNMPEFVGVFDIHNKVALLSTLKSTYGRCIKDELSSNSSRIKCYWCGSTNKYNINILGFVFDTGYQCIQPSVYGSSDNIKLLNKCLNILGCRSGNGDLIL